MNSKSILKLLALIIACELAGALGSVFTNSSIDSWYATLVKPELNPPSWLFAPVWIVLYALMGISLFLVLQKRNVETQTVVFCVQLYLNVLWSLVFFGLHSVSGAFLVIIPLWLSILGTMVVFRKKSRNAVLLLVPYLVWVSFAALLNYELLVLNGL